MSNRASIARQLQAALATVENFDGEEFTYDGVHGLGVFGIPEIDATLLQAGPQERVTDTLQIRKAWYRRPPRPRLAQLLQARGKRYLVKSINADDPISYHLDLIERKDQGPGN